MAKTRDILSKVWLRRRSSGILARRLCGGPIAEFLPTEQPHISNRQVDMLVRNEAGEVRHIEFQATNEDGFGFRMMEYWVYLRRELDCPIRQTVFYIGREPMRLQPFFEEGSTRHAFEIVNLQDYDAATLLASADWGDNLWALGARGDQPVVLGAVLARLAALSRDEQEPALAELTALSGIMKLDELLKEKLKEFPMLTVDLKENAVVRPLIEEGRQEGRLEGRQEGRLAGRQEGRLEGLLAGRQELLLGQLGERFGAVPAWASERIHRASAEQLDRWARRVLRSASLEQTLE